jgi:hypothetical protein
MVAEVAGAADQVNQNQWAQAPNQGQENSAANPASKPTPGLAFKPGGAPAPATAPKQIGPLTAINTAFAHLQSATAAHDAALDRLHDAQKNSLSNVAESNVAELTVKTSEASRALDSAELKFYLVVAHKIDELRSGKDDFASAYDATERLDKAVFNDGKKSINKDDAASFQIAVREQINSYLLIFAENKLKALALSRVSPAQRTNVITDVAKWVVTLQDYPSPTDALPIARLSSILYSIKNLAENADKAVPTKLKGDLAVLQKDLVGECKRSGMKFSPEQQQELNVSLIAPDKK